MNIVDFWAHMFYRLRNRSMNGWSLNDLVILILLRMRDWMSELFSELLRS